MDRQGICNGIMYCQYEPSFYKKIIVFFGSLHDFFHRINENTCILPQSMLGNYNHHQDLDNNLSCNPFDRHIVESDGLFPPLNFCNFEGNKKSAIKLL